MKTMPAAEAKNKFGVLMDTVQREAVAISKKGRTAAVVMPVQEIKIGLDQIDRGEVSDGGAFFDEFEKELDD